MKHKINKKNVLRPILLSLPFLIFLQPASVFRSFWLEPDSAGVKISLSDQIKKLNKDRQLTVRAWVTEDEINQVVHFSTKSLMSTFESLDKYSADHPDDLDEQVRASIQSQNILFEWMDESPVPITILSMRIKQEEIWNQKILQIKAEMASPKESTKRRKLAASTDKKLQN